MTIILIIQSLKSAFEAIPILQNSCFCYQKLVIFYIQLYKRTSKYYFKTRLIVTNHAVCLFGSLAI